MLGRLLYTTGHVAEAVRLFLDILRGSPYPTLRAPVAALTLVDGEGFASEDKSYLDDFRVAFAVGILLPFFLRVFSFAFYL